MVRGVPQAVQGDGVGVATAAGIKWGRDSALVASVVRRAARAAGLLDAAARLLPALPGARAAHGPLGDLDALEDLVRASATSNPGADGFLTFAARSIPAFYSQLLSGPDNTNLLKAPSRAACQKCHTSYRQVAPSGDLLIPHRAHVEVLKIECVACHKDLVHSLNRRGFNRPEMERCLEQCHDGDKATNECVKCHTRKQTPASHTQRGLARRSTAQMAKSEDCGDVPRLDARLLRRLPREAAALARRQLEEGPRTARQGARRRLPRVPRRREVLQGVPLMAATAPQTAGRSPASSVLALLLLVVLPGFLATRPGFFGRVPSLSEKYETWSTSTHAEAGCEECHVPPGVVARTALPRAHGRRVLPLARLPLAGAERLRHADERGVPRVPQRPAHRLAQGRPADPAPRARHRPEDEVRRVPRLPRPREESRGQAHPADGRLPALPRRRHREEQLHGVPHQEGRAREPPRPRTGRSSTRRRRPTPSATAATSGPRTGASTATRAVRGRTARTGAPRTASRSTKHRSCEACHDGAFCIRCHGEVPPGELRSRRSSMVK